MFYHFGICVWIFISTFQFGFVSFQSEDVIFYGEILLIISKLFVVIAWSSTTMCNFLIFKCLVSKTHMLYPPTGQKKSTLNQNYYKLFVLMISITYCNGLNRDSACFVITRLLLVLSLSSVVKIKMRTPITDLCHTSCFWDIKIRRAVYSCFWWLLYLGYWINNGSFASSMLL